MIAGMTTKTESRYIAVNSRRQHLRLGLMLVWVIIMPVTLYYFSPYLPFMGLGAGLISGSVFVFAGMFGSAIFLGRAFCGWLCPAGGTQDFAMLARPGQSNRRRLQWVKFGLWLPWLGAWIGLAISATGLRPDGLQADFFFQLENGISVSRPATYVIYLSVLTLILGISLIIGRRAFCHTACWMAPFMVIGQKLGMILHLPGLHLSSQANKCTACGTCSSVCPMSLDVAVWARKRREEQNAPSTEPIPIAYHDCILCLRCADACPAAVLHLGFGMRS